jgi:predicted transposase/invertase (TIGR01784 family)
MAKITELVRFDWFIKYMFRDKSDFEILEGFLSELLNESVQIVEILESEGNQTRKKDKFNRVDVMIKNSKGEFIIVEVQNNEEYDYLQRILYGTSKTIIENIAKGQTYSNVKKVLSVSVVYFRIGQGEDYIYHGTTSFKGIHKQDELALSQEQIKLFGKQKPQDLYPEYYLIKAGDFNEASINNTLDEWVYFLKTGNVQDNFKAKGIDKAKKKLEVAKLSPRKRVAYERDTRYLHSEASWAEMEIIKQKREEEALKKEQEMLKREKQIAKKEQEATKKEQEAAKKEQEATKKEQEAAKKEQELQEKQEMLKKEEAVIKKQHAVLKETKINLAKSLKTDNLPIEKIIFYTGLSREDIEKL